MHPELLQIANMVEAEFAINKQRYGSRMQCRRGCNDCCHHLFDIDTLEARAVAERVSRMPAEQRERLRLHALAYRERLQVLTGRRLACPALAEDGSCDVYDARPLICRMFGMPIYNPRHPGELKACELNFRQGEEIEPDGIVERQSHIHERWETLKETASDGRRYTVADAILFAS